MPDSGGVEAVFRAEYGRAVSVLVRVLGDIDLAEEAVQEAFAIAVRRWPDDGTPPSPAGWIITTARNKAIDRLRREAHRDDKQAQAALLYAEDPGQEEVGAVRDERLRLLFTCCHPALASQAQVALTLRLLGGLTTAEIAHAFLVPEATMAQRISRSKQRLRDASFDEPGELPSVLRVLYLMFNEGYAGSIGTDLVRVDLAAEAIRLTRSVYAGLPEDGEVAGLLALMLLTDARRPARTGSHGELVPLSDQDRSLWGRRLIAEGINLVSTAMARGVVGEYQLQASIAALHDAAPSTSQTDWAQIRLLYDLLGQVSGSPMVALNRAIASAMVDGPAAGLAELERVDAVLPGHYRLDAVRGHLYELLGDSGKAVAHYTAAAQRTASQPEQVYLTTKAAALKR